MLTPHENGPIGYERDLLRHLSGEDVPGLMWGAAMSEALGYLKGSGYARIVPNGNGAMRYEITDKGAAALGRG